ncbi:MAG: hypothetical protein Q8920_02510 [Bacillota bacterium]|nr:hypothetical protein [Bacillota bacterium]
MGHEHEGVVPGLICEKDLCKLKEAVCIQTEKIFDSCKEKDCIENARVHLKNTKGNRYIVSKAINVKCRKAEVIDVYADIEPVPFKRGFYTVDIKFFIKVKLDFFLPGGKDPGCTTIVTRTGVVLFDKKVILFGSEGNVRIFKFHFDESHHGKSNIQQDNLPTAKIEVAEPICLGAKIEDILDKFFDEGGVENMPRNIVEAIDEEDDSRYCGECDEDCSRKRVVATIGLFSIIKLVRLVQLIIPAFDYCVPNKKCIASTDEDPCELFETIDFPVDEFYPPQMMDFPGALEAEAEMFGQLNEHEHPRE